MKERLSGLEKIVRLNLEARKEGIMSDLETKSKIKKIKKDIVADINEINNQLNIFTKSYIQDNGSRCPDSDRITEHFRITCEYVLRKFRDAVEKPAECIIEYV